jgi:hypothetical protein
VVLPKLQPVDSTSPSRTMTAPNPRGLGDGDPHEMLVTWKGRHLRRARPGLARRGERGPPVPHRAALPELGAGHCRVLGSDPGSARSFQSPSCPTLHQILVFERDENQHAEHRHKNAEGALDGIYIPGLPHAEPFAANRHETALKEQEPER